VLALVMFEFAGRVLLMRRARRQATTGKSE
jgi:hypothetical protein